MYYSLRGNIIHLGPNIAVVECAGVGYKCQTTINTIKNLKVNKEAKLYTHLNVREDAMELFGFYTEEELSAFKTLIGVSGVGPKVGLAILSVLSPQQISIAIASEDLKAITMAPGVGKKLAQRIVLELKDKFKITGENASAVNVASGVTAVVNGNVPKVVLSL